MGLAQHDDEYRARVTRHAVHSIRRSARAIRDGTTVPARALSDIVNVATVFRPRRADGEPVPWDEVPFWAVYRPFYEIAVRWSEAQKRGDTSPELTDELQVEMYSAAIDLVGERESQRRVEAVQFYDQGHPLPEPRVPGKWN